MLKLQTLEAGNQNTSLRKHLTLISNSFHDGLAFCAIISRYDRSIDFDSLVERNRLENTQLAFNVAERVWYVRGNHES